LRRIAKAVVLAAALLLIGVASATAASLAPIGNFDQPIFVTSAPANPDELLVVERPGRVIRVEGATRSLYADLSALGIVSCCLSERGLLSIAPAPDFASSGRFYAAYTGTPAAGGEEGDVHVDAFRPTPGGGTPTREPILSIPHSLHPNHNGGQLEIGPDGYLYISLGDGGGSGDPLESGQDLETLLGKVLRIDPRPGAEPPYGIPPGNPFAGGPGRDEIWAYGLRNPWRFSFDPLNSDLLIADVGQGLREEVDLAKSPAAGVVGGAGANYGWNCREGFIAYPGAPEGCASASGFIDPVFDYPHADPGGGAAYGCAITGGYVVHDSNLGALDGRYVYADFCTGEIRSLVLPADSGGRASGDRSEGLLVSGPTSFGEDACGRLYVASDDGTVYRLQGSAGGVCPPPPPASASGAQTATALRAVRDKRVAVRLQTRRRPHSPFARLIVSVSPCGENAGASVQLHRGGRGFAGKRLSAGCIARFRVRLGQKATFRAVFEGQRSQVRTIALAKPSP
jgi:glucose/arabinose dehydrogenase